MSFAYEIEYKGKTIRCRTLGDARRVLDELEGSKLTKEGTPWTEEEVTQFTGRIHLTQRRLLAKLLENGITGWVEDSELCDLLGLDGNRELAGTLSGISKVALMFNIEPRRVYTREEVLGERLGQILKDIHIPDEVVTQLQDSLSGDQGRLQAQKREHSARDCSSALQRSANALIRLIWTSWTETYPRSIGKAKRRSGDKRNSKS